MFDDTDWSLMDFDDGAVRETRRPVPILPGCCRKCGKHIGRGVRFHEKWCKGSIDDDQGSA